MSKKVVILFFPLLESGNVSSNYPWALVYLHRMIRHLDIEIILIDERLDKGYDEIIRSAGDRLLYAGVSAMVGYQIVGAIKFSETIKKYTSAPVIWGGWFPSVFPEMILNDGYADYVCIGQGEQPLLKFTENMLAGKSLSDIAGIGYRKDGGIQINPNHHLVDPASFPQTDLTLIDVNRLIDINGKVEAGFRGADYLATIGCPNNCSFCNLALVFGSKWYPKKNGEILYDLKDLTQTAGVSHITFSDDNFFAGKKFVLDFCNELICSGLSLTWEANAHVGYFLKHFNDDDIRLIYRSGCRRIKIGAESGDQEVLDLLNKRIKAGDNLRIVKLLKRHGIHTRLFTMVCFPHDPDRDFRQTLNMIGRAILIDRGLDTNINFYKPIPRTPLYELCVGSGFQYPSSTAGLIDFFSKKFTAPWYKRDYQKQLDYFQHFYFLFADPFLYKRFPLKLRPVVFFMSMFLYPAIWLRFKCNWMSFPFEAMLFGKIIRFRSGSNYLDSVSTFKVRSSE